MGSLTAGALGYKPSTAGPFRPTRAYFRTFAAAASLWTLGDAYCRLQVTYKKPSFGAVSSQVFEWSNKDA